MAQVSVIMPVYNGRKTIHKAIKSLQAQTFSDLDIFVVDDGSTDGTFEVLQSMAEADPRIRLFRTLENLGAYHARALALNEVRSEWVTLLDADDWYEADRIEVLLNAAKELKADLILDNLQLFDHVLNKVVTCTNFGSGNKPSKLFPEDIFRLDNPLLGSSSIGYSKPMVRMEFLRKHNINYWGKYRNKEDYVFLAEIILFGAQAFLIPQASYVYVLSVSPSTKEPSPYSYSNNDAALIVAQCDELMQKYGLVVSSKSRDLLLHRKKLFLTEDIASKQKSLQAQGQYGKAAALFLKHPYLLIFRLLRLRNCLYNNQGSIENSFVAGLIILKTAAIGRHLRLYRAFADHYSKE